ncbi:hypothetical protein CP10743SC13_1494 [Chlamydia psittaci 10_743_SC13]|nr:hypothetical protein CP10743SC13_1494 [Chlamydia psittaci 10_743_SC13]
MNVIFSLCTFILRSNSGKFFSTSLTILIKSLVMFCLLFIISPVSRCVVFSYKNKYKNIHQNMINI